MPMHLPTSLGLLFRRYSTAAEFPKMKDPTGMFIIKMLWLIPKSFAPNSSLVIETEIVDIAPVDKLIMAVLM